MALEEKLTDDMKTAMKSKDKLRLSVIRMVKAKIKNAQIEKRDVLNDDEVLKVIARDVKQHKESITAFTDGGRTELAEKEEAELEILMEYMPQQMSRDEVVAIINQAIAETGATGPQDKGKVMGKIMAQVSGKADGKEVNTIVMELLAG
ncbi:MAG: GatB/YqeY domain-containing protein [Chloroflexi bacterium]|jgi:uncharacterized protein|nr:GatB/YqeY domain-containing protein [Chloroflexota bacterium]MBT7079927.1 GatB/YqeY domain-containing protein [Chloroflexota bacterium]